MCISIRETFATGLTALLITACSSLQPQAQPTEDLAAELAWIQPIAATQAVSEWTRSSLARFQQETGRTDFRLEYIASLEIERAQGEQGYQLYVIGGPPPEGWFTTPLGEDAIAFIVHPENPIRDLDSEALGSIFAGRVQNWGELGGREGFIQPVVPLEQDELRELLAQTYLDRSSFYPGSRIAPTPQAMLEIVAENPAAIGFVPLHVLDSRVKALSVQGIRASERSILDGTYPLIFPILATAPAEPNGTLRTWLEWIQIGSGGAVSAPLITQDSEETD
jgi:hypothetical protein